jgi:DNA-binding CsgD family transcriptional regulator
MPSPVPTPGPLRVALVRESALVTLGFNALMAPYASRVEVLADDSCGRADLTLHDSLAGVDLAPAPGSALAIPHAGTLVTYTWNTRPDLVDLALASGASGVLSKDLPAPALVAALEAIQRGEVVVEYGNRGRPREPMRLDGLLTPREDEIITLITRGLDNFSVARETALSINSVKSYIRSAYRKMGVSSRSQAVLWGLRHGYLDMSTVSDEALTG